MLTLPSINNSGGPDRWWHPPLCPYSEVDHDAGEIKETGRLCESSDLSSTLQNESPSSASNFSFSEASRGRSSSLLNLLKTKRTSPNVFISSPKIATDLVEFSVMLCLAVDSASSVALLRGCQTGALRQKERSELKCVFIYSSHTLPGPTLLLFHSTQSCLWGVV